MSQHAARPTLVSAIQEFLALEAAAGILLVAAAGLAILAANSPIAGAYQGFLHLPVSLSAGDFAIDKSVHHWINDGLMAIFFFLVGLEIKREALEGELSDPRQVVLPLVAAVGGMAVPALVYWALNQGDSLTLRGWAIPTATDIAFALGVLSLLGDRVPRGLKLFLLTLAIIDDLGAIIVIALFYAGAPSVGALALAGTALVLLVVMNLRGVARISPYLLLGLVLWSAV
ncbi:MAG: Na+/H+ antiporter NhaA, partial [Candidatus Methylophosphatis roskildensis]